MDDLLHPLHQSFPIGADHMTLSNLHAVNIQAGGSTFAFKITSKSNADGFTHPLPQVVLTSSKRDALTFEAKPAATDVKKAFTSASS